MLGRVYKYSIYLQISLYHWLRTKRVLDLNRFYHLEIVHGIQDFSSPSSLWRKPFSSIVFWKNDHNVGKNGLMMLCETKSNEIILCEEKQNFDNKIIRCNICMLFCPTSQRSVSVNVQFPLVASYSHRHSLLSLWFGLGGFYRSITSSSPKL